MSALAARAMPDVLRPLGEVLAEHPDHEPAPGFAGLWQGQLCQVTAVLERTAVVEDADGERHVASKAQLLVDERAIDWRTPRPPARRSSRVARRYTEAERMAVRDAGDRRALAAQAAQRTSENAFSPGAVTPEPGDARNGGDARPPAGDLLKLRRIVAVHLEASGTGVSVDELRGPRRDQRLVELRRTVARRMRAQGLSLPEIGRAIGRDHSTVLHLLRTGASEPASGVPPSPKVAATSPAPVDDAAARTLGALGLLAEREREAVAVLVEALGRVGQLERELACYRSTARRVERRVERALHTDTAGRDGAQEAR